MTATFVCFVFFRHKSRTCQLHFAVRELTECNNVETIWFYDLTTGYTYKLLYNSQIESWKLTLCFAWNLSQIFDNFIVRVPVQKMRILMHRTCSFKPQERSNATVRKKMSCNMHANIPNWDKKTSSSACK